MCPYKTRLLQIFWFPGYIEISLYIAGQIILLLLKYILFYKLNILFKVSSHQLYVRLN